MTLSEAFVLHEPIDDRAEWLEWRRSGIGGSDVPAVVGLADFAGATPMRVYLDKVGLLPDIEPTEAMLLGQVLEPVIIGEFEKRMDLHVACRQWRAVDAAAPWRRSTLDGLAVESADSALGDALGVVEVKATRDEWDDGIPTGYQLQVQWQMGLAGQERGWLVALHQSTRLRIYELDFDPDVFTRLQRRVDAFWHDHVLAENPPPVIDADLDVVKRAWRDTANAELAVEADDELVQLARDWHEASTQRLSTEKLEDELEAALRVRLGDAVTLTVDGQPLVTLKSQKTAQRIDEKALRARLPRTAGRFTRPAGTTRVLRATNALRALTIGGQ